VKKSGFDLGREQNTGIFNRQTMENQGRKTPMPPVFAKQLHTPYCTKVQYLFFSGICMVHQVSKWCVRIFPQ